MNKTKYLIYFAVIFLGFFGMVSFADATVSLPWSTTFNCADWTQSSGLYNVNCDGLSGWGGWTCDNGDGTVKEEQITAAANNPNGGGGKGQRHWSGDGSTVNSGGIMASFNTTYPEIWVKWYMRYPLGFAWSPTKVEVKWIYFTGTPNAYVGWSGFSSINFSTASTGNYSSNGIGWNQIMSAGPTDAYGNKEGDGLWHSYEAHLKAGTSTTSADGVIDFWIDGNLILHKTTAVMGTSVGWDHVGIGSNQGDPLNGGCMAVDYDDFVVSATDISDSIVPSIPTNLFATVISSSQINLSWTASTDAVGVTGYKIYRNGTQIATSATNSYSNTGLTASTLYSYTVSAYDAAGNNSAQTSSVSAITQAAIDTTPPSAPSGVVVN